MKLTQFWSDDKDDGCEFVTFLYGTRREKESNEG